MSLQSSLHVDAVGARGCHRIVTGVSRLLRNVGPRARSSSSCPPRPRTDLRQVCGERWHCDSSERSLMVSPSETCCTSSGRALGSSRSAPLMCATTVLSNDSRNSRRILATRFSASLESLVAAARSCTVLTVFADAIFEIAHQALDLLLHLANLAALLFHALGFQAIALTSDFLFLLAQFGAFSLRLRAVLSEVGRGTWRCPASGC